MVIERYFLFREQLAKICLIFLFFVPLLVSTKYGSGLVNLTVAFFQFVFFLILLPESASQIVKYWKSYKYLKFLAFSLLVLVIAWMWKDIPVFGLIRTWVYASLILFIFSMFAWLDCSADKKIREIYQIKLSSIVFACLIIALYTIYLTIEGLPKSTLGGHPPIYRNIRHLNYDLAMILPLMFFYFFSNISIKQYLLLILVIFFGYYSVWSAGRGAALSLLVFAAIIVFTGKIKIIDRKVLIFSISFILGGIMVFILGETYLLSDIMAKTVNAESVSQFSSGRNEIWIHTLKQIAEHNALLFGMGPNATIRIGTLGNYGNYVQPHNFIVQWIAEFGILGSLIPISMLFMILKKTFHCLKLGTTLTLPVVISALIISTLVFAFFDGQFYHGLPLTMFVIFSVYLITVTRNLKIY